MKKSAPLTTSQFGIFVECASHKQEAFYNLPYIYVLDRSLDGDRLLEAIRTAFMAHPTLFTRIELNNDGDPIQTLDLERNNGHLTSRILLTSSRKKPVSSNRLTWKADACSTSTCCGMRRIITSFWTITTSLSMAHRCRLFYRTSTRLTVE